VKNLLAMNRTNRELNHAAKHALCGVIVAGENGQIRCAGTLAACWLKKYFPETHLFDELPISLRNWLLQRKRRPHAYTIQKNADRLSITVIDERSKGPYCLILEEYLAPERPSPSDADTLTQREAEILSWAAQGKANWAIAKILNISPGTVRKHLQNVYRKLGVENRTAAALQAQQAFQPLIDELSALFNGSASPEFKRAAPLRDQIMEVKSDTGLTRIEPKRRPVKYARNNGRRRSRV
jgi:DNA-binding CsgD family transcriptional regulator